jgi:hypothetical protein
MITRNANAEDDLAAIEEWKRCWEAILRLQTDNLPSVALFAEASQLINSCRVKTCGREIEWIEEQARGTRRFVEDQLAADPDDGLKRLALALDGALSVLRGSHRRP